MHSSNSATTLSSAARRTGWIISLIPVVFLLFDSIIKIIRIQPVIDSFNELGYPISLARTIGLVELVCTIVYLIPGASLLGAILLTAFLGGATAVKLRFEDPWSLFSVAIGILFWVGLYLRNGRIRFLLPLEK